MVRKAKIILEDEGGRMVECIPLDGVQFSESRDVHKECNLDGTIRNLIPGRTFYVTVTGIREKEVG